ncbi:MAG TPA: ABC transporter permease [Amycolatopsis sp.]|uniref:ABC transporter permease n=1 Tax=Amycolatopsis sp. TaxID=37632 RepID=UPI002B493F4B|nr:ABC transporter permease [Amycolatopsis sp.]HKS47343.1 ABC transporter permease [Amycolatopsis sp.]
MPRAETIARAPDTIEIVTIRPERAKRGWRPPRSLRRAAGPVAFLLLWYLASATGLLPSDVLASPVDVVEQGIDLMKDGELPEAIFVSGKRVFTGFLVGGSAALALSLVAGLFRLGEDLVDATVGMIRTIPWVGLIPLFIIWFGIDEAPKVALVAVGVAFPLYFNLYGGIRTVDTQLIEAGKALGLDRAGLIRHVILPGALPSALVGLRYALGNAWLALVFGETVNAVSGIGYLMNTARENFLTDVLVLCLVVYAVLGLISDFVVRSLGRYLLAWRSSFEGA